MSKGRNKRLISLRDETLIRRYYYWTEIERRRFDDALKIHHPSKLRQTDRYRSETGSESSQAADQRPSTHALPRWIASIRPVLHP